MKTCVECDEPITSTCGVCEQSYCAVHALKVRLYINGQRTATIADIHARAGHPVHPEAMKGDTWEWRVEG